MTSAAIINRPSTERAPRSGSHMLARGRELDPQRYRMLRGCFAVSGAAGLVDQVCFSKYLAYVVGSTAYAVSAVLAAFMAGLALGALFGGRLSQRVRSHLDTYGYTEVVVGITVAVAPLLFGALTPLYAMLAERAEHSLAALSLLRWALAALVVVAPAAAMGATLPLVSPALGRSISSPKAIRHRERRLAGLYAANTFGGAVGALAAAYLLLPMLGLPGTLLASAAVSACVGITVLVLNRRLPREREIPESAEGEVATTAWSSSAPVPPPPRLDAALAFLSGFLVFVSEVVATHLLAVIVGNSAYAFGLILAVFLVCLFAGATLAGRVHRRFHEGALPLCLSLSGLALAATLPFWDTLPLAFAGLGPYVLSFAAREALRGCIALAVLALPVTLMGVVFPLLLQRAARQRDVGVRVARLTAINTVGAIAGALAGGYVLLPIAGSQGTLMLSALAFAAAAVTSLSGLTPGRAITASLATATAAVVMLSPNWDPLRLTAGTSVYFDAGDQNARLLYMREDPHGGVTTVTETPQGVRALYTNGKFQGNTGWEMSAQRYFAHYPCLFVNDFNRALVIGLGTGTTLGTLAAYPFRRLEVVEISPAIVDAAQTFFRDANQDVLQDPRVRLTLEDARNWLLVHDARFDLISMELTSVWFAGAANLYSEQFYVLVSEHLKPDGIFQQWVQLHHIEPRVFATILNTLRQKFAHVALFYGGGQGILIASQQTLRWSLERALAFGRDRNVSQVIPRERTLGALIDDVLLVDDSLDRYLQASARAAGRPLDQMVSTDDNLYLEYATPRGNVLPWEAREELVAELRRFYDPHAVAALAIR